MKGHDKPGKEVRKRPKDKEKKAKEAPKTGFSFKTTSPRVGHTKSKSELLPEPLPEMEQARDWQ